MPTPTEREKIARRRRLQLVQHLGLATTTSPPVPPTAAPVAVGQPAPRDTEAGRSAQLHPWATGPCGREHTAGTVCATCFDAEKFNADPGLESPEPSLLTRSLAWDINSYADTVTWAMDRILAASLPDVSAS